MPLLGTLSTMPLPDLLQWLGSARRTGTLQVERNKVVKYILFREGRVVGCSSDDPPERLGQFLLSRGKISEDQLRRALQLQETTPKHLGMILVQMGALSEEDLTRHLTAKSEETIYSIFDWDEAVFRFEDGIDEVRHVLPVSLMVEDILLRGLKRYDEMRMIRGVFHDPELLLRQTPRMPPPEVFHNKMARRIYESIDGERTVAEILLLAHGSEYLVTKFLYELERNGFIAVAGKREEAPASASRPVAAAPAGPPAAGPVSGPARPVPNPRPVAAGIAAAAAPEPVPTPGHDIPSALGTARDLMKRGEFDGALQILDTLYKRHPQDESLRRLMTEAEAAFIEKAYRHYLPGDKIPVLTRPVESLESETLSPEEFYLLSRIDGTWDVKSIIQITPLRELKALRTLKAMRERGIIDLRDPR